jgi:hypothetical protein
MKLRRANVCDLFGGGEVEEALEGEDGLVISGGDTPLLFELAEDALDAAAIPVSAIIGMLWHLAV